MNGQMQESGLPDIIPFIYISVVQGQSPVFSHPQFRRAHHGEWLRSDGYQTAGVLSFPSFRRAHWLTAGSGCGC